MRISSPANARIKAIRSLRERKTRQESGCYFAEGLRLVVEAAQQHAPIVQLVVAPDLLTSTVGQEIVGQLQSRGIEILEVSAEVFGSLASKESPVGIGALLRQQWTPLQEVKVNSGEVWVALDEIADPGNLGTILRTSDATGAKGVILLDHSTDPYDPTAVRASMGAVFSQKLVKSSFMEFSAWKYQQGVKIIGTSGAANVDYQAFCYPERFVLLMGSERQGLTEGHRQICDELVRIPMVGRSDSLNLAVATAVALYEVFNQKRRTKEQA